MEANTRLAALPRTGFNGAMAVRPWMVSEWPSGLMRIASLQWGHGREAMDGPRAGDYGLLGLLLQWGHGREAMDGTRRRPACRPARCCFNGAMAVRPWMVMEGDRSAVEIVKLQWGHGREAMDGRARCGAASVRTSFNGAMAVRPWMDVDQRQIQLRSPELQWGHGREAMDGAR